MAAHPLSLLDDAWIPVLRASGARTTIRPAEVTSRLPEDPIVAFDWPRADFDAGMRELMIGLLSTACWRWVADLDNWLDWWEQPPTPKDLERYFAPLARAFMLDGDGPRFMQNLDDLETHPSPVGSILIDAPGENTLRKNRDLFVKRDHVPAVMARSTAAIALFTLQTFAPSGGAGHRTSLRGGGPMTTLIVPPEIPEQPPSLWHLLWLNAAWPPEWPDPMAALERVFPWLASVRRSDKGQITTPEHVHPAQCYWGMPRRIRLDFEPNDRSAPCDLTGDADEVVVRTLRTRPHGSNYAAWGRYHPLTPYRRTKRTDCEWLPLHPQPGRLGYRNWVGLVVADVPEEQLALRQPAHVLSLARARLEEAGINRRARVLANGFDMDNNMKARGFVESQMPLPLLSSGIIEEGDELMRCMVRGAREAEAILGRAVGMALYGRNMPAGDGGERRLARDRFWDRTELPFLERIDRLADLLETGRADETVMRRVLRETTEDWHRLLTREAVSIFDELAPLASIEDADIERLVGARRFLTSALLGYGRAGKALFGALVLPPPETRRGSKGRTAA